jgi:hypothetical protein
VQPPFKKKDCRTSLLVMSLGCSFSFLVSHTDAFFLLFVLFPYLLISEPIHFLDRMEEMGIQNGYFVVVCLCVSYSYMFVRMYCFVF